MCKALKCCGKLLLCQLLCLLLPLFIVAAFVLFWQYYLIPHGEEQIRQASEAFPGLSLNETETGINTQWPTNTTGMTHFLDTHGGTVAKVAVASAIAVGTTASALTSIGIIATGLCAASGVFELVQIVEQAQFISLLGQLQAPGAPRFFHEFTKEMAWTNFNFKQNDDGITAQRRLMESTSITGVERYSKELGISPDDLFTYTLTVLVIVLASLLGLYLVVVGALFLWKSKPEHVSRSLFRRVVWITLLLLLLSQYILSMTAFFELTRSGSSSGDKALAVIALGVGTVGILVFGSYVVWKYPEEIRDNGTYEHEQRPFCRKYGSLYEDFNFDNRFFFVPKVLVAVATGALVGAVTEPALQVGLLLLVHMLLLSLVVKREPFLYRTFYYIGVGTTFLKILLLLLMLLLTEPDTFPKKWRDAIAVAIIAINLTIFACLIIRQLYVIYRKIKLWREHQQTTKVDMEQVQGIETPKDKDRFVIEDTNYSPFIDESTTNILPSYGTESTSKYNPTSSIRIPDDDNAIVFMGDSRINARSPALSMGYHTEEAEIRQSEASYNARHAALKKSTLMAPHREIDSEIFPREVAMYVCPENEQESIKTDETRDRVALAQARLQNPQQEEMKMHNTSEHAIDVNKKDLLIEESPVCNNQESIQMDNNAPSGYEYEDWNSYASISSMVRSDISTSENSPRMESPVQALPASKVSPQSTEVSIAKENRSFAQPQALATNQDEEKDREQYFSDAETAPYRPTYLKSGHSVENLQGWSAAMYNQDSLSDDNESVDIDDTQEGSWVNAYINSNDESSEGFSDGVAPVWELDQKALAIDRKPEENGGYAVEEQNSPVSPYVDDDYKTPVDFPRITAGSAEL